MKRRTLILAIALLPITCWPNASIGINLNPAAVTQLARTYGYLMGQRLGLEHASATYPDLRRPVTIAQMEFNSTFPNVEKSIAALFPPSSVEQMKAKMNETFDYSDVTKAQMVDFVAQVRRRAKGEVEDPIVLNYMLAVCFESRPAMELSKNFTQRFSTVGHKKAQGVELNLQLPLSWEERPGNRPHIVRKWVSENGNGLSNIVLDLRDVEGYRPTREELKREFESGELLEDLGKLGTIRDSGLFTIEQLPGYWVEYDQIQERVESTLQMRSRFYQFFYQGKAIGLMFATAMVDDKIASVNERFPAMRELARQVVNSVVLPGKY